MQRLSIILILALFIFYKCSNTIIAQPDQLKNAGELQLALEKLDVLGSVLYIAAHPDDENTALMAYFSKGKKYRTGYLSLTRGSGGQNLIGSEKGVEIGILRTQELLSARRIDGAEQYFSRALDFGYSKSPEETFDIWGKEKVLSDVVWVIRKFKPDIIITRFPVGRSGGHGHHTASALLAAEAFTEAADPSKFPEQLKYVQTWQAKRIFWNTWNWRATPEDIKNTISVDVGDYNPLLAESYLEVAAKSRSMHKSQGFGTAPYRGSRLEYFSFVNGDSAYRNLFDGINITWDRVDNGSTVGEKIKAVIKSFNDENPSASIPGLIDILNSMNKIKNNYWVEIKRKELLNIIRSCAGLWMEADAGDYSASPGDFVTVKTSLINRSGEHFVVEKINFPGIKEDSVLSAELKNNEPYTVESKIRIPESYPISQPYWLVEKPSKGLFNVADQKLIGLAENPPSVIEKVFVVINGASLEYDLPLVYKWDDRVDGEEYRPFEIRPPVIANVFNKVALFADDSPKEIKVKLKSNSPEVNGKVKLIAGKNWKLIPSEIPFILKNKYDEKIISFSVTPPSNQEVSELKINMEVNGRTYDKSLVEISYPHIKREVYFPESEIKLVRLDIKKFNTNIGYVMGSGDEIPDCLRDMGFNVTLLTDEMLEETDLSKYDAIVTGIRAYNTRERLKYSQPRLINYVKNGGTLIVQYNVAYGLQTDSIGPYPFKISTLRITDEDAKINFIDPANQLLVFPNKITEKDFNGWVQERGLYFASEWDKKYQTVFSAHDPGEKDLEGGTLFTHYGKGIFIYTGLAWFRELPEGVPGAFRIFVNMISAGKYNGLSSN
jgi:LmbE family N-acetylglucosaminyl deacetylase